jgi:hypothetical protein
VWKFAALAVAVLAVGLSVRLAGALRDRGLAPLNVVLREFAYGTARGSRVKFDVPVAMRDGVVLRANLYLPLWQRGQLGTIYIRAPYDKNDYGEMRGAGHFFARNGYAVVVQDLRGRHASQGEFSPYERAVEDGYDTTEWITKQPWSNGRVGTFGCSALGEVQWISSKAPHPAWKAMVPLGAGGAAGSAGGRFNYFGGFEGGIFNMASVGGWFARRGQKTPGYPPMVEIPAGVIRELPSVGYVARVTPTRTDYERFLSEPLTSDWWSRLGYLSDADETLVPSISVNNWFDQTVADTLFLTERANEISARRGLKIEHRAIIGPAEHCGETSVAKDGYVGLLQLENADQPYMALYLSWFDYWVAGRASAEPRLPRYRFFVVGENRWVDSDSWPPITAQTRRLYLASRRGANSREGDGRLTFDQASDRGGRDQDQYMYDPADPVPTRGGPVCCTGLPDEKSGPADQKDVESRRDVLVYTSDIITEGLRVIGPVRAHIDVASSTPDTDLVARLVDVQPDGRAISIQEGALRLRYRDGIARPQLLEPGRLYQAIVDMRATAYLFKPGHRIRLHVTSSSFPRLERNLNTGGRNYDETHGRIAKVSVGLAGEARSYLELSVVP